MPRRLGRLASPLASRSGPLGARPALFLVLSLLVLGGAPTALAASTFRPRIGTAMGIVPPAGQVDIAKGTPIPVVYHGGTVMRPPVTVHTVFWAPPGYSFDGSPAAGVPGYEALQQQFFTDAAHDSGATANLFSVLGEYPDAAGPTGYGLAYNAATDSINDTHPYPARSSQCPSPAGTAVCVTDNQVTSELNRVISANAPTARGLHDVWFVFLPPSVDECMSLGACGTNAFGGYHSLFNLGAGPTVYSVVIDPLIELPPTAGGDPLGNPVAEGAINTSAHELVEAITDPEGTGWMDPNGFEVGDKCENGPQLGTPLGFAPNGAPYNQLINGHQYLVQAMWSNAVQGCVQHSSATNSSLPLASVSMHQFSSSIRGDIGRRRAGVSVDVALVRAGQLVATALTRTRADGRWGPVALRATGQHAQHAFGDDRDVVLVSYGPGGPKLDGILTGSGGNPFTQSGYTGWYDLDTGFQVKRRSVAIAPCSQVGVLGVVADGVATAPPITLCGSETGIATVPTRPLGPGSRISFSSEDNRTPSLENPSGALVTLTIPLGEPGSVGALPNSQTLLNQSGFPSCMADLRAQSVQCSGLVPNARYRLIRRRGRAVVRARADANGLAAFARLPGAPGVVGGDVVSLRNSAGRTLTTLHVAHLRVAINGEQTVLSGGRCEPGDYYGRPPSSPPVSAAVGAGISGSGQICPGSGRAVGLSDAVIEQTDDRSGGLTRTQVPLLEGTAPSNDATVYGGFTALAQSGLPSTTKGVYAGGAPVSLSISAVGSRQVVFRAANVDTAHGVPVSGLAPGVYAATWVVSDANGDTRTVVTKFVQAG